MKRCDYPEYKVVAAMLLSRDALAVSAQKLNAKDFHMPVARTYFTAMKVIYTLGCELTLDNLRAVLEVLGCSDMGDANVVATIMRCAEKPSQIDEYIREVEVFRSEY